MVGLALTWQKTYEYCNSAGEKSLLDLACIFSIQALWTSDMPFAVNLIKKI